MATSYEFAPATKFLASHCAVCRRPLLDSISVEAGIGPVCRERHGYDAEVAALDSDARATANQIIAKVARPNVSQVERELACATLRLIGFVKLADRIQYRGKDAPPVEVVKASTALVAIRHSSRGTGVYVKTPYNAAAVDALRTIPGRKWAAESKEWFVPNAMKASLWTVLRTHFAGAGLTVDGGDVTAIPAR